jgi:hypothetical protein
MKTKTQFENIIKSDLYQVFLFTSPAHIPLSIWTHPWVVINKQGNLTRYEVRYKKNRVKPELGHIHINDLPPFDGIEIFSFLKYPRWNATLLGQIEGGENSGAQKMCEFIENSTQTYKDKSRYFLFGPNSNTYIKWILDNSPEFEGKLRWNALGKNYHSSV